MYCNFGGFEEGNGRNKKFVEGNGTIPGDIN
jgi:hypothetical protein